MADVMIQVESLTKEYGTNRAVDQVSFNVHKGEVLGFLGPNGAGKSTTMKILTCFLAPTAGTAKVAGFDVFDQSLEVRQRVGYLPEDTPLYRDMTVREHLDFAANMHGISTSNYCSAAPDLIIPHFDTATDSDFDYVDDVKNGSH